MQKQYKILICDDDEGITDVTRIVLEEKGYKVIIVNDGKMIKRLINTEIPDLILSDLWMPTISGEDITKEIKSNYKTKEIPIIIFSASKDTKTVASKIGASDFLTKPFNIVDLENIVSKYLP